ncbi:cytochrome c oxidase accessory protein CcoG [Pontibacter sp. BT310]|uniref:Cytochrome c oxidase accessory protein CcoG n=1 Tax=Pontibacter populi TaxID=890055 RepID=A0ABS6XHE1_9BACT|nr:MULTISPECIES: cytochrome c oxidase accessory protein CcoG [Pontibacter]MBJ6119767.1 cytochrome c oxidase accessory protein CcoG [Pontibacter sp. BT310]MBR0572196.1 cytochrome c oxidase accessory protein CcoG [Microvirga sp. STS03]MBW3366620.1 cytochrome c oxidase accessory protein CcoG [Pontibacter populi]
MATKAKPTDEFRDHISTVDEQGKRIWVYPRKPKGKLYNYRKYVSYLLLALLFAGPFIKINGLPLLMLNVVERKFVIFGVLFWPQDFFILVLAFLALVVFIILFTVVYGRIFCGWVCPQTIFLEMVFRRIEYAIEGDFTKQKALNKMPWNTEKILKKGAKTAIFLLISFVISNLFLAYVIGVDELQKVITEGPINHMVGFGTLLAFTGVFYWVFASFREQVCTIVCPYGRLQGVMQDKKTLVVAYDYGRGEPRGKLRKGQERTEGDCIDCNQCVQVCPTGIDIRNGAQQLECINCTACIDACNDIMRMIDKPEGLIRYESEEAIETGKKWTFFTNRVMGYTTILVILMTALTTLLLTRDEAEATILRTPGQLYQKTEQGHIKNLYNISVINKTNHDMPLTLKLLDKNGAIDIVGSKLVLPAQGIAEGVFFAEIAKEDLTGMNSEIEIGVYHGDELITTTETKFLGPAN